MLPCPRREIVIAAHNFFVYLMRHLCVTSVCLGYKPFPIFIHAAKFIVFIFRRDENVGIYKVLHVKPSNRSF